MKKGLAVVILVVLCLLSNSAVLAQRTPFTRNFPFTLKSSAQVSRAEAFSDGNGVFIKWQADYETRNLGFNIYRIDGGRATLVNPRLIISAAVSSRDETIYGKEYAYFDANGNPGASYFIESVAFNSRKRSFSQFFPREVADLTEIAGVSSEFLQKAAAEHNPVFQQSELILPEDLESEVKASTAAPDSASQNWVAAQPGVKIGVKKNGFYRVTRAELESAGFNVNASPALWQLYLDGVEQAINVAPNGDFIEFFGRTIDTVYSNTRIYYLLVGAQNGKRIGSTFRRSLGGNVVSQKYDQSFVKQERSNYISDLLNGEKENFFGSVITSSGTSVNFNLSGVDFNSPNSKITVTIQGIQSVDHEAKVSLNGTDLGTLSGARLVSMSKTFDIPTSLLKEGSNTLNFTATKGLQLFDTVKVDFSRKYQADQNRLMFYTDYYRVSNVTGFTSPNVRVFDMTNPDNPLLVSNLTAQPSGSGYAVKIPPHRPRVLFVTADEAFFTADSLAVNAPSTLSTTAHSADLVVIAHQSLLTQANDWANYRRGDGFSVEVVDVEDVYDEFSFGVSSANAIRDFLEFAKSNWQTAPRYALFVGDSSYDAKNYIGFGNLNFVPTKLIDTVYMETGSDEALADFNDDGLAEIAVGRISARTPQEVTDALNKTKVFEQSLPQAVDRGTLCVSDLPQGYDFEALCGRVMNELPNTFQKSSLNRATEDSRGKLLAQLNSGKYLVNYSGHGTTAAWVSNSFFSRNDVEPMTNGNNLTVFTMLTCLNGYFIHPVNSGLSESLLKKSTGGAAATWSSTGLTTPDIQEVMARRFFKQLGAGSMNRIGDLIKDAKTVVVGGRDVRLSWVLLGDPTLKVR